MVVELCAQYPRDHSAIAVLNFFLNSGAQVDVRAGNGLDALHCSAAKGSLNIATLLLQNGANPNILAARGSHFAPLVNTTSMEIPKMERSLSAQILAGF
jgi:ankyrin repeat protein